MFQILVLNLVKLKIANKKYLSNVDVIFTALPNGEAQKISNHLLKKNTLIDLAADFRLNKSSDYQKWYKQKHKSVTNIKKSIYSLPEIIGKKINVRFDDAEFLLNLNVNIASNLLNNDCPINADNFEVIIIDNKDNFSEEDWRSLYKLSEQTFVEETDSSKQGAAGAGLTDND